MKLQTMYVEHDPQPAAEVSPETQAKRYRMAWRACQGALDITSWRIANRLAKDFGCEGCKSLGIPQPKQ